MAADITLLLQEIQEAGWDVRHRAKHYVAENPETKRKVFLPCTPSDVRSIKNCRAQLRRAGCPI